MNVNISGFSEIEKKEITQKLANIVIEMPQIDRSFKVLLKEITLLPEETEISIDAKYDNCIAVYKKINYCNWKFDLMKNNELLFTQTLSNYEATIEIWNDIGNFYDVPLRL